MTGTSKKLMVLLPLAAGILWASVGMFVRPLTQFGATNYTILFARGVVGVAILGICLLLFKREWLKIELRDLWMFLGAGLLGMMALNLCYVYTINTLQLSLASVLLDLAPVFALVFGALFFKEMPTMRQIVAIGVVIVGCVLMSGLFESSGNGWSAIGMLVGLLSAFFYAVNSLFSRFALEKGYHSVTITFYSLVAMAIALAPFAQMGLLADFVAQAPLQHSAFLVLHSLCTSVIPYVLFTIALDYVSIGTVSAIASASEPVASMTFGLLAYNEVPTPLVLIGVVVVIAGVIALNITPGKKDQGAAEPTRAQVVAAEE